MSRYTDYNYSYYYACQKRVTKLHPDYLYSHPCTSTS